MALSSETAERVEALYRERLEAHFNLVASSSDPSTLSRHEIVIGRDTFLVTSSFKAFQVTIVFQSR